MESFYPTSTQKSNKQTFQPVCLSKQTKLQTIWLVCWSRQTDIFKNLPKSGIWLVCLAKWGIKGEKTFLLTGMLFTGVFVVFVSLVILQFCLVLCCMFRRAWGRWATEAYQMITRSWSECARCQPCMQRTLTPHFIWHENNCKIYTPWK